MRSVVFTMLNCVAADDATSMLQHASSQALLDRSAQSTVNNIVAEFLSMPMERRKQLLRLAGNPDMMPADWLSLPVEKRQALIQVAMNGSLDKAAVEKASGGKNKKKKDSDDDDDDDEPTAVQICTSAAAAVVAGDGGLADTPALCTAVGIDTTKWGTEHVAEIAGLSDRDGLDAKCQNGGWAALCPAAAPPTCADHVTAVIAANGGIADVAAFCGDIGLDTFKKTVALQETAAQTFLDATDKHRLDEAVCTAAELADPALCGFSCQDHAEAVVAAEGGIANVPALCNDLGLGTGAANPAAQEVLTQTYLDGTIKYEFGTEWCDAAALAVICPHA